MVIYEPTKKLNYNDDNDPRNWKCRRCDIKFTYYTEWIFHKKCDCPNTTGREKWYTSPNGSYEATKKSRQCYRCGRYGHYFRRGECYALKDTNGVDITWGEPAHPRQKPNINPDAWETVDWLHGIGSGGGAAGTTLFHVRPGKKVISNQLYTKPSKLHCYRGATFEVNGFWWTPEGLRKAPETI